MSHSSDTFADIFMLIQKEWGKIINGRKCKPISRKQAGYDMAKNPPKKRSKDHKFYTILKTRFGRRFSGRVIDPDLFVSSTYTLSDTDIPLRSTNK